FSSRRRHTRFDCDWSSDVCSSDLARAIEQGFPGQIDAVILGILRDKDCEQICRIIAPIANIIYVCPVPSERAVDPLTLAGFCFRSEERRVGKECRSWRSRDC